MSGLCKVTKVVAESGETCLWYVNDVYVGHDDQWEIDLIMDDAAIKAVLLEKLVVDDDTILHNEYEDVLELARCVVVNG